MVGSSIQMLTPASIVEATQRLQGVVRHTALEENISLSEQYGCRLFLKREDLQIVRSYKLRGAFNKISLLTEEERACGVVCASAGNHAQGFAYSCYKLGIKGKIFMPITTPRQKVDKARMFGKDQVDIILTGDTYDDAYAASMEEKEKTGAIFIHPFNDPAIIAGQGTVGLEILQDSRVKIDYIFAAVGGGGLSAGVGSYFKQMSPHTQIIGIEPSGAPAMAESLKKGEVVRLAEIDKFVDGAAVRRVGDITFSICKEVIDDMILVPEGKVCSTILQLYNEEAIVVEPAGALSISALDYYREKIKGKNVVCILSGGNNDIMRTEEIKERSMLFEGLKHYFIINFPQRAGALREFLVNVLGPKDDITHFEYIKKSNKENGPAFVGIELEDKDDYGKLVERMSEKNVMYTEVNNDPLLFRMFV